jgi:hypothetical protein
MIYCILDCFPLVPRGRDDKARLLRQPIVHLAILFRAIRAGGREWRISIPRISRGEKGVKEPAGEKLMKNSREGNCYYESFA